MSVKRYFDPLMHIFDYTFLDEGLLPAEIVNLTATIAAFNAISDTRKESNKSIYTEPEKIARVQSVKSSNAIEGIVTTDARIKQIVDGDSAPLNHDEREIEGYRDVLDEIHSNHDPMSFSENMILHIHDPCVILVFLCIHPFADDDVIIRTKLEKPSKVKGLALIQCH